MCVYNAEDIAQQLHNAISTEKCKNVVFNSRACASTDVHVHCISKRISRYMMHINLGYTHSCAI